MMGDWPKRARVTCLVLAGLLVLAIVALAWTHARHRERYWMSADGARIAVLDTWTGDVYRVTLPAASYTGAAPHAGVRWDRHTGRIWYVKGGRWQR